jgi:hypothetical protein
MLENTTRDIGTRTGLKRFAWLFVIFVAGISLGAVVCGSYYYRCFLKGHAGKCICSPATEDVSTCAPGPWGQLEYITITLEIPKVWTSIEAYTGAPTRWFFDGMSPEQVTEVFRSAGLNNLQIDALMASAEADPARGIFLTPPERMILDLNPSARSYIYSILGKFPENPNFREPHRYLTVNFDRWLNESTLPPETLSVIRQLTVHRGRISLFSDVRLALSTLNTFPEKQKLLQLLSRQTTLMPTLNITPESDIEALALYWSAGSRQEEIQALMESLKRTPHGGQIDIVYLLPPFVRERIYTYPRKTQPPYPDCHYTSMNFFNSEADERFMDMSYIHSAVLGDYKVVKDNFQLGDLILFRKPDNEVVHACNFIADDIVFTKNGQSRGRPWVLMHMQDVVDMYSAGDSLNMVVLRRK